MWLATMVAYTMNTRQRRRKVIVVTAAHGPLLVDLPSGGICLANPHPYISCRSPSSIHRISKNDGRVFLRCTVIPAFWRNGPRIRYMT